MADSQSAAEERARRVLLTVDLATENGYARARRAVEALHAARAASCPKHRVDLVAGNTRSWCERCLAELAQGPLESDGMIGRDLDETVERLTGMVELRNHIRARERR